MSATGTQCGFVKMHGLGNDFVVFDFREAPLRLDASQAQAIADRKTGIGCDQLITLLPDESADAFMRIQNADGDEVDACGNASRCVGAMLMDESGSQSITLQTNAGLLVCSRDGDSSIVSVDMGVPALDWQTIPLSREMDTIQGDFEHGPVGGPGFANIGNPHAVFFVDDAEAIAVDKIGPEIETDPLFPERINVEFAQIISPELIRMRVWERGVGITRACGTGACATMVAASRRGLVGREATIRLDGGDLHLTWDDNDHIIMTGDTHTAYRGQVTL
jgi:diaminopimelate epimerase